MARHHCLLFLLVEPFTLIYQDIRRQRRFYHKILDFSYLEIL